MIEVGLGTSDPWIRLGNAMAFYRAYGFTAVDLPWVVSRPTSLLTCSDPGRIIACDLGDLVGSAEQSFLEQVTHGFAPGDYVACTPCFRNEPELDVLHRQTFMQVELFSISPRPLDSKRLHDLAMSYFSHYAPAELLTSVTTPDGMDIDLNTVEVGSYGVRYLPRVGRWCAYGTGLAEPRFTQALLRGEHYGL